MPTISRDLVVRWAACGATALCLSSLAACGEAEPDGVQGGASGAGTGGAASSAGAAVEPSAGLASVGGASVAGAPVGGVAGVAAGGAGVAGAGVSSGGVSSGGAAGASAGAGGSAGSAGAATNPDPAAPCPRCVRLFDGKTFNGWEAASSTWTIVDGAMRGSGGSSRAAYTKEDYGNFRLFVTSRMDPVNGDHLGILFWAKRPTNANSPTIDHNGWMQWMPPFGGMWSYPAAMHHEIKPTKLATSPAKSSEWSSAELLFNLDKGTLRVAVDGLETTFYEHSKANPDEPIVKGPFAMMRHGGGVSLYKDIFVEVDPTEDKLYSVKAK